MYDLSIDEYLYSLRCASASRDRGPSASYSDDDIISCGSIGLEEMCDSVALLVPP